MRVFSNISPTSAEFSHYAEAIKESNESHYAFVVNIPIEADERTIDRIRAVCGAYYQDGISCPPFAIVFCMSRNNGMEEYVAEHEADFSNFVAEETRIPITIFSYQWGGSKFPYGEVRNEIIYHEMTKAYADQFKAHGLMPYLSIADSDTGKRTTLTELGIAHAFQAFEDLMTQSNEEEIQYLAERGIESDLPEVTYLNPLVVCGGYRVREDDPSEDRSLRTGAVEMDMFIRQYLAESVNVLGPYAPEPNLYLDAPFVYEYGPRFSAGGSEYEGMRRGINQALPRMMDVVAQDDQAKDAAFFNRLAELLNNRHTIRGPLVVSAFDKLQIATNTQQLFEKAKYTAAPSFGQAKGMSINPETTLQDHRKTNAAKTAYLDYRQKKKPSESESVSGGKSYKLLQGILQTVLKPSKWFGDVKNAANCIVEIEQIVYALVRGDIKHVNQIDPKQLYKPIIPLLANIQQAFEDSKTVHGNRTASSLAYIDHSFIAIWNTALGQEVMRYNPAMFDEIDSVRRDYLSYTRKEDLLLSMVSKKGGEVLSPLHQSRMLKEQEFAELASMFKEGIQFSQTIVGLINQMFSADNLRLFHDYLVKPIGDQVSEEEYSWLSNAYEAFEIAVKSELFDKETLSNLTEDQHSAINESILQEFTDHLNRLFPSDPHQSIFPLYHP